MSNFDRIKDEMFDCMPENDYQKNKVDAMDDVEMENEAVDL
jgi:hypothetical protein